MDTNNKHNNESGFWVTEEKMRDLLKAKRKKRNITPEQKDRQSEIMKNATQLRKERGMTRSEAMKESHNMYKNKGSHNEHESDRSGEKGSEKGSEKGKE